MPGPNSVGGDVDGRGINLHELGAKYAFSTPGPRRKIARPVPETVFHYTDAPGLFGIITNKELWFTDTRFLNDVSEGEYARTTILNTLRSLATPEDPIVTQVVANLEKTFGSPPDAAYVACFCWSSPHSGVSQSVRLRVGGASPQSGATNGYSFEVRNRGGRRSQLLR